MPWGGSSNAATRRSETKEREQNKERDDASSCPSRPREGVRIDAGRQEYQRSEQLESILSYFAIAIVDTCSPRPSQPLLSSVHRTSSITSSLL